jgi:membrane peptidoglycan carboxypeptidase
MCCGNVRISTVYGGTWPAQIWHAFMLPATARMPERDFPTSEVPYVTLEIDVTRGCLANPYTPLEDIRTLTFPAGAEPDYQTCTEPSSYQTLTVPTVVGMQRDAAIAELQSAGFTVAVEYAESEERPNRVIAQDPSGGSSLMQTGTVTITVSRGAPEPVDVPNVIGMGQAAASVILRDAGFEVSVARRRECDPADPSCDYRPGVVWAQDPTGEASPGSTVRITVNP